MEKKQLLQPQPTSFSNLNYNKTKANQQNYMLINEVQSIMS